MGARAVRKLEREQWALERGELTRSLLWGIDSGDVEREIGARPQIRRKRHSELGGEGVVWEVGEGEEGVWCGWWFGGAKGEERGEMVARVVAAG